MSYDRLTPLDASFLHLEDASSHMHVACVMIFGGEAPPYDRFVSRIEERLHLVPRYRQRLAQVPLAQARPVWVDDTGFDARYHIRATALPRPGGEYELQVLAGRVFSQALNRDKPLWEVWLVEGLQGDRFAILSKTHHALVDGISGLDILSVLFAPEEEGGPEPQQWRPEPTPSGAQLLADAVLERLTRPAELVRPARALLRGPRRVLRGAVDTAVGVGAMAWAGLSPAPRTPYNRRQVSSDRRFVWVRGSLDDVKQIKNSLGGTVNDVMLTTVTRALRRHLLRRGEDIDGLTLKAFVPVSVRPEDQRGTLGNQVAGMVAPLPVYCSSPTRCLRQISDAMSSLKDSGQAVGAQALTELAGFAPPTILSQASRLISGQRFINLVVTNVPGPQFPLYLEDGELLDIFPMVPLGTNLGLGVAILSYNGTINFGLVADFDSVPDLEDLAGDFSAALEELADAAGVKISAPPRQDQTPKEAPAGSNGHRAGAANGNGNGNGRSNGRPVVEAPGGDHPTASAAVEPPSTGSPAERAPAPGPRGEVAQDRPPDPITGDPGHVEQGVELVAEFADVESQEGAGPQVRIAPPWPGYGRMRAAEIVDRLSAADEEVVALVSLYEGAHKRRQQVLQATERALRS